MAAMTGDPITRDEADRIADRWVADSAPPGMTLTPAVYEFDLGFVVWGRVPRDQPPLVGAGRGIIDRETGEMSVWPSLPIDSVIERFRVQRAEQPPAPRSGDPAEQARRDLRRVATPTNLTHLTLTGGLVSARSIKGDSAPQHHPLVADFFATGLAPEFRERGGERTSEAAAISDALYREDARRARADQSPLTMEQARDEFFAGAEIVTYMVREKGDPMAGKTAPPGISAALLSQHFGFQLIPPAGLDAATSEVEPGDD